MYINTLYTYIISNIIIFNNKHFQIATLRNELLELINANSTAIEAEETRATKAEEALETKINGVSQTATDAIAMAGENQTAIGTINEKIWQNNVKTFAIVSLSFTF